MLRLFISSCPFVYIKIKSQYEYTYFQNAGLNAMASAETMSW